MGGLSYVQGSSREHVALCLMFMGIKAVLCKSLERIHTANLINFGIALITFKNEADYDNIDQDYELEILNIRDIIANGRPMIVNNKTKGTEYKVDYSSITDRVRNIILVGGMLDFMAK